MMDTRHSSPVTRHAHAWRILTAAMLCAMLAGCGMINWNISNSSDGCPPQSKFPCP